MTEPAMGSLEYSHPVPLETLGTSPKQISLAVGEHERAALAKRFELVSIESFTADVTVRRVPGSLLVEVKGTFAADIVQSCVITEAPVAEQVREAFSVHFGPETYNEAEVDFELDDEDPPELIENDVIELGEWIAQLLAIEMNPYPKAPGAKLEGFVDEDEPAEAPTYRPFESLLAGKKDQV